MTVMIIVEGDDWEGIYVDNRLVSEDHSIDSYDAVSIALEHGVTVVQHHFADREWLAEEGYLPDDYSDVQLEG